MTEDNEPSYVKTVRLPTSLINKVNAIATIQGVGFSTLIKEFIILCTEEPAVLEARINIMKENTKVLELTLAKLKSNGAKEANNLKNKAESNNLELSDDLKIEKEIRHACGEAHRRLLLNEKGEYDTEEAIKDKEQMWGCFFSLIKEFDAETKKRYLQQMKRIMEMFGEKVE